MANTEPTIDLDSDPDDFEETYAELLVAVKHNYDAAGNLAGAMDPSFATRFIIAEYTNLIDDFMLACQRAKLRWIRFASGTPEFAAPIGTQYTNTATAVMWVNRTGAADGWHPTSMLFFAGNPENDIAAPVGSLCTDTSGGTAVLYFKRSGGSTSTGWAEVAIA